MPFDPCREWLGIDATDLKDPHRVLGISPTLTDGDEIARLAAERLASLSLIAPGPFGKAHSALLNRVAEARDTLLATANWSTSEESAPAATSFDAEPPPLLPAPSSGLPSSQFAPQFPPDPDPVANRERELEPAPPMVDAAVPWTPSPARPIQNASGGTGLGLFAIFLAVSIAAGYYAYKRFGVAHDAWDVAIRSVIDPLPEPLAPAHVVSPSTTEGSQQGPDLPAMVPDPAPAGQDRANQPSSSAEPRASMPEPHPAPSTPQPDPESERRIAEQRARAAEFVNASLSDAFQALQREEFDAADRAIDAASREVGDDVEDATRVERWRLAAAYARAYVGFRDKAFQSAGSGREYEIDGKRIVVIEVTPSDFVYRLAGRNVSVSRKTMSPVLEIGVVENWFGGDGRAANYLFLGTRWLCKEPPNHTRARAAWQKAGDGGENVAPLMALLDDPITQHPDAR